MKIGYKKREKIHRDGSDGRDKMIFYKLEMLFERYH